MTKEEIIQRHARDTAAFNLEWRRLEAAHAATTDRRQQVAILNDLVALAKLAQRCAADTVDELRAVYAAEGNAEKVAWIDAQLQAAA